MLYVLNVGLGNGEGSPAGADLVCASLGAMPTIIRVETIKGLPLNGRAGRLETVPER